MIEYKLATDRDRGEILDLLGKLDSSFPIPLSEKTSLGLLAEKFLEKGYVYLALDGALPVGMIGFYANDSEGGQAYVSVVGVLQSYRGKGIAKRMLSDAVDMCKRCGMRSCVLYTHTDNTSAISLYKKLGFVPEHDMKRPDDIRFTKDIRGK